MNKSIILVEDELSIRIGIQHALSAEGYAVETHEDADSALQAMASNCFDLLITDMRLPGLSGLELMDKVKELHPSTGMMLITAFPEIELAVKAMRHGAFDFLCKPFSNEGLLIAVERYFNYQSLKLENTRLKTSAGLDAMIGGQAMQPVFERIRAIADACTPVLVLGPSGTGKELVANALHNLSSRSGRPFIKINCSALPEHLLESELFGHEKGAFTGAHRLRVGKFEAADGGTFFFDEVGDMSLALQAKLLRVLEDGEITRIGGNSCIKVDVRTIFATAKDIDKALEDGAFREDLYYRINVVPINLPPARARRRQDQADAALPQALRRQAPQGGHPAVRRGPDRADALRFPRQHPRIAQHHGTLHPPGAGRRGPPRAPASAGPRRGGERPVP